MLKLGDFELHWLQGGTFELDGGTMFGPVPKVLWQRKLKADDDNYINFNNSPILLKTPKANIVIETGFGNKLNEKQIKIFRVKTAWDLPGSLAALGLGREDIDYVILTHCDYDHAGGVIMHNQEAEPELTFPRAKHMVQRIEWEDATNPNRRSASTYFQNNFDLLVDSPLLKLIDGDHDMIDGVRLLHTAGHTRGHQVVRMESKGKVAIHMADLLPTHVHYNPLWVMSYDNFPLDAIEQKERLERMALEEDAWITFYHDTVYRACKFDEKGNVTDSVPV